MNKGETLRKKMLVCKALNFQKQELVVLYNWCYANNNKCLYTDFIQGSLHGQANLTLERVLQFTKRFFLSRM